VSLGSAAIFSLLGILLFHRHKNKFYYYL
jgi:hypothetical protein